jgi:CHAT domain
LRIFALFSLPPAQSPLNLRRERQMLRRRVQQLVGASGLAVELHVLQYGVTRNRLRNVLEQGEGWDVIHFSGHGLPGALVLERPDGRPDQVTAIDLARLLRQADGRLKLVTLSACLSAAASIDQTLSWLGIASDTVGRQDSASGPAQPDTGKAMPTVARALTEALGCAVLGMRYAVEDEFAVRLADGLYDRLLRQRQSLPQAIRLTLNRIADDADTPFPGALSMSAPALFGPKAAELVLTPPRGAGLDPDTSLAYVPPEPRRFVGRVTAMTQASAALAIESDKSGVLFYGMAGAGKTSCAVELIYHHAAAARFQAFVWYSAPEQGKDITLALRDFALALERHLPQLAMLHVIDREDALRDWLPRLVEVLENNAILIALDNLESLLTETGEWRDPRWGLLIEGLLARGGLSRTLVTSRIRPTACPPQRRSSLCTPCRATKRCCSCASCPICGDFWMERPPVCRRSKAGNSFDACCA